MPGPAHEKLSRREREIMNAIFALGNDASAEDIRARLSIRPSYSAVRAMLVRLEAKGHVRHREEGLRYIYTATILADRRQKRAALRDYVKVFFGGSGEMLTTLLRQEPWTDEELDALGAEIRPGTRRKGRSHDRAVALAKVTAGVLVVAGAVRMPHCLRIVSLARSTRQRSASCLPAGCRRSPFVDGGESAGAGSADTTRPGCADQARTAARGIQPCWRHARRLAVGSGLLLLFRLSARCGVRVRCGPAPFVWAEPRRPRRGPGRDAGVSRSIEPLSAGGRAERSRMGSCAGDRLPSTRRPGPRATSSSTGHEIEHIRRNDWVFTCWRAIVLRRLLVSSARVDGMAPPSSRLRAACDDGVSAADGTAYAEQLLLLARRLSLPRTVGLFMAGRPISRPDRGGDRSCHSVAIAPDA